MTSTFDIVKAGLQKLQADHAEAELGKLGDLRVGNTGLIQPDGTVIGKCARLTYLRLIGVEAEGTDLSREFMFAAGRTNEDSWVEMLEAGGVPKKNIRRESDIPVSWEVEHAGPQGPTKTLVTGRPDIVIGEWVSGPAEQYVFDGQVTGKLARSTFVPKKGLELKLICSLWTARRVAFKGVPEVGHLLQAAHYSWQLGVPFELWYTNRVNFAIPFGKQQSWFPRPGELGSEYIQYDEAGSAIHVMPFILGYQLKFNADGVLEYRRIGDKPGMWRESVVTKKGIENYFRTVAEMPLVQKLPARPAKLDALGEKTSSSACSYCALAQVCDKREKGTLDDWVEAVREWQPLIPSKGSMSTE